MSEINRKGWRSPDMNSRRRGWCPGALAPMLSGDGYIFRLRLTNGVLSFKRAKIFADLARRFGNGAFDLSARANLQMRGVRSEDIAPLQEELSALGLLDADARAEAVRNIVPSPLAGFDASALLDARPLVEALEGLLARETALHDLPAKFGFSIDGGGALPLAGLLTDIDFTAIAPALLEVSLGGVAAGFVTPENLVMAAEGLARNFLRLRGEDRRMSALAARIGVAPLIANLSTVIASGAKQSTLGANRSVDFFVASAPRNDKLLGAQKKFVGAGLLFGRIDADALEALAREAQAQGAEELRLTPWRTLLAVGLTPDGARKLAVILETFGFILDGGDPRLAFSACPGAPACPHALADVRGVALALAAHWRADAGRVHVSGCPKGCAFNGRALTLVAETQGFSLVENGFARDEPQTKNLDVASLKTKLDTLLGAAD